jgi:integrase
MAKAFTALTARNVRPDPEKRREVPAGHGLYLVCQPSGVKSWAFRYSFGGRSCKLTLGQFLADGQHGADAEPEIGAALTLAGARELAARAKRQAKGGVDPAGARRKQRIAQHEAEANTLSAIAAAYLKREGKALRTFSQRQADLELLCRGPLGKLPISEIRRSHYRAALDRIADNNGPVRSDRCLAALTRLLNWHASNDDFFVSPLAGVGMRRVRPKDLARHRTLDDAELRRLWMAAERCSGPFGRFLHFTLLTATRRGESAGLRRSELSSDGQTWTIPGSRYKNGYDTVIPLSQAAQAIIATQPVLGDFVFSADGTRALGGFDKRKADFDKVSGVSNYRLHDLRRTARTLLSRAKVETKTEDGKVLYIPVSPDVAERCLGHAITGVRGVYDRFEYADQKRDAFEALAQMIERTVRPPPVTELEAERRKRRQRR